MHTALVKKAESNRCDIDFEVNVCGARILIILGSAQSDMQCINHLQVEGCDHGLYGGVGWDQIMNFRLVWPLIYSCKLHVSTEYTEKNPQYPSPF